MSLAEAVVAAQSAFPWVTVQTTAGSLPLPVVMVAIAGAESSWDPTAVGDYGLGGPTCPRYGSGTSFGLWQIHNVHAAYIAQQAGSSDPCVWIPWLFNPANNAAVAASVYRSQGFGAWTTYNNGAWQSRLPLALAAFGAEGASPTTPPHGATTSPIGGLVAAGPPSFIVWALVGLAVLTWLDVGEKTVAVL